MLFTNKYEESNNMENNKDENYKLLEYRLEQIEQTIKSMKITLDNFTTQMATFASYGLRLSALEDEMNKAKEEIAEINSAPYKKDANKWNNIIEWIFKAIVLSCMGVILTKVGLK